MSKLVDHYFTGFMDAFTNLKRNKKVVLKRSAGVAPEVNLRNIAQARKHASESTLALKPRADITRSPKQGYQWPHKKDMCPPKILKKEEKMMVLKFK